MKANDFLLGKCVLILFVVGLSVACGRNPTVEPGYTFYRSPQRECGVEFIYLDEWTLKDSSEGGDGGWWINPPDDDLESPGNDRSMYIMCLKVNDDITKNALGQSAIRDIREAEREEVDLLDNRTVQVDGHDGLRTEVLVRPVDYVSPPGEYLPEYPTRLIHINIMLEDRLYRISFGAPEEQADGDFRQEFEKIVESIKFVP